MKTYIGVSETCSFNELSKLFEPDYTDPDSVHRPLERIVGASYIRPGDYEIYDREDYPDQVFDRSLLETLFPFRTEGLQLWAEDFDRVQCVFFIKDQEEWARLSCAELRITDAVDTVEWLY